MLAITCVYHGLSANMDRRVILMRSGRLPIPVTARFTKLKERAPSNKSCARLGNTIQTSHEPLFNVAKSRCETLAELHLIFFKATSSNAVFTIKLSLPNGKESGCDLTCTSISVVTTQPSSPGATIPAHRSTSTSARAVQSPPNESESMQSPAPKRPKK